MARIVELDSDDVLVVRLDRDPLDSEFEWLSQVKELLGVRAVLVMRSDATIASLPADEVLRAVAGS